MQRQLTKRQLYVTNWAPNGTNDLLVVEDGEVIACLDEATFGFDVSGSSEICGCRHVVPANGWDMDDSEIAYVHRIDLPTLSLYLAHSPARSGDAAVSRVLGFLNDHGIV